MWSFEKPPAHEAGDATMLVSLVLLGFVEEVFEGRVEFHWCFEVREVAGPFYGKVAGVGDLLGHLTHNLRCGEGVLRATQDECGYAYLAEQARRIGARAHGTQGCDDPVGGALEHHGAHRLHDVFFVLQGVGGEEALQLELREYLDALLDRKST